MRKKLIALFIGAMSALGLVVAGSATPASAAITWTTICKNATFSDGTQVFRFCVDRMNDTPNQYWVKNAKIWNIPLPSGHSDNLEGSAFWYINLSRYYYGTINDGQTRSTPSTTQYQVANGAAALAEGYSTYDGKCHQVYLYETGVGSETSYTGQC